MGDGKTIGCESRVTEVHTEAGQCDESGKCDPTKRALRLRSTDVDSSFVLFILFLFALPCSSLSLLSLPSVATSTAARSDRPDATTRCSRCRTPARRIPLHLRVPLRRSLLLMHLPCSGGRQDHSTFLFFLVLPPLPSLVSINVPASTTLRGYLPSPYRFPSSARLLLPAASPFPLCILVLYRPP